MRALLIASVVLLLASSLALGATSLPTLPGSTSLPPVPDAAGLPGATVPEAPALPELPGTPDMPRVPVPLDNAQILPEAPTGHKPTGPSWTDLPASPAVVKAATAAGGAALAIVGFALYSRLGRHELLDHKRRDEVFQLVRDHPGIPLTDIGQRTGLGWGTAVYHLDRLERGGFLTSEHVSGRRCYFPVGTVPREDRASLGALQQETTRSVAAYVSERPGATQGEMCEALGLTASAASKQVSKLESAGLVRRERAWKNVHLHPAPNLAAMLRPTGLTA